MKIFAFSLTLISLLFCFLPFWYIELKPITFALCLITSMANFYNKDNKVGYIWLFNSSIWLLNLILSTP